jgi:hypothetical protein
MSPITHLLIGWLTANATTSINKRERAIITIAGVAPDIDGLGIVADLITQNSRHPLNWWGEYHHILAHNLGFALLLTIIALLISTRRWTTALLALISVHLHLICDLVGSRGPDGYQWPIPYLLPFSNSFQLTWQGQWALNAWPNFVITIVALILTFWLAWQRGYSPLEIISASANRIFVDTLRQRFPHTDSVSKQSAQ